MLTDGTVVIVTRRNRVGPVFRYPIDFWGFLRSANRPKKLGPWRAYQETYPDLPFFLPGEEPAPPKKCANDQGNMREMLFRPQFDRLSPEKKQALMERLSEQYHLDFVGMEHFDRWGQSGATGVFRKEGREFVFVPGDTVTLGWEGFVQGMEKANREELADIFAEIEYEGTVEEFLRQGMTPVRQMTIGPMFVGRKLEEAGSLSLSQAIP